MEHGMRQLLHRAGKVNSLRKFNDIHDYYSCPKVNYKWDSCPDILVLQYVHL